MLVNAQRPRFVVGVLTTLVLLATACAQGGGTPTATPAAKPTEAAKPAAPASPSPALSPAAAASPSPATAPPVPVPPSPVAAVASPAAAVASPSPAAAAGAPNIPAPVALSVDPTTTAYLLLDLTSAGCQPRRSCPASLPAVASLLQRARDAKTLVVYSDTPTAGVTIMPEVAQQADEPKVTSRADKFFGTDLDDILKAKGIKTVVIVGTAANGAVLYTSFGANLRGYTVVVAEDGVSSDDAFAVLLTRYQLLNQPGFSNPENRPLAPGVTLSRTDLIRFQ